MHPKHLLTLLCALFLQTAQAQQPSYWLQPNQHWQFLITQGFSLPIHCMLSTAGDTVLNGQPCVRLMQDAVPGGQPPEHFAYAQGNQVYVYVPADNQFHRMYDFDLEPGDTLALPSAWGTGQFAYRIDTVTTQLIDGQARRMQDARLLAGGPAFQIVEGIGMVGSLLTQLNVCAYFLLPWYICDGAVDGPSYYFLCYGDEHINLSLSSQCTLSADDAPGAAQRVTVYPVPTAGEVFLTADRPVAVTHIALYDGRGRRIHDWPGFQSSLSLHELPAGIYWLKVAFGPGEWVFKKVVKL